MLYGIDILGWIVIAYFLVGAFAFMIYGFVDKPITIRTLLAFSVSYLLLINIITRKLLADSLSNSNSEIDYNAWDVRLVDFLFGEDAWS